MNEFKKDIVHMQEEERIKAIRKLISVTKNKYGTEALEEVKKASRAKALKEINNIENEIEDHIENATESHIEDENDDDD